MPRLNRPPQSASKYRAKAVIVCAQCDLWHDGESLVWNGLCRSCKSHSKIRFASKAEAGRYGHLRTLEKAGEIDGLELQPLYPISINGVPVFTYKGDFRYWSTEGVHIEDVKGKDTALSRLKRKCVEAFWGIKIELVRV